MKEGVCLRILKKRQVQDMALLEKVQHRVTKMMKGLWGKAQKLWLFSMKQRRFGGVLSMYINTWKESTKRTETGLLWWCPVTEPEAMHTNLNTGGSLWTPGSTFPLWGELSTGTGCSLDFGVLHPWRYSKAIKSRASCLRKAYLFLFSWWNNSGHLAPHKSLSVAH